jgi:hypothetical protein
MKNLLLFFLVWINCGLNCFSQEPNPELFQTWYLINVQSSDLEPLFNVLAFQPTIEPTLTISNTLDFTGVGACNTFNGGFTNLDSSSWQSAPFSASGLDCGTAINNQFENSYFSFLQSYVGFYQIYPQASGLLLRMDNLIFGSATFLNYSLKTSDFELQQIAIYPNPAKTLIHISTNQLMISKIQIINSLGQNVKTIIDNFENIDISGLSSAFYTLRIDTALGTTYKKIIKE